MTTSKSSDRSRILVVDDDPLVRRAYVRILRSRFEVVTASDGAEAVVVAESGTHLDLIVMDVEMPVMDGYEASGRIAAIRPELASRIIVVSGGIRDSTRAAWFAALPRDLRVEKPVDRAPLIAAIERILGTGR